MSALLIKTGLRGPGAQMALVHKMYFCVPVWRAHVSSWRTAEREKQGGGSGPLKSCVATIAAVLTRLEFISE
jgi:hypothetical protein